MTCIVLGHRRRWLWLAACWAAVAVQSYFAAARAADDAPAELGLTAPPGFEVSLFAGDDLAHDIFSMTIDSHGRVVVAGLNFVKTLHDDDGDGRADRATLFSALPASGAHGLCFDGNDLICTGDNCLGRLRDADGDGAADGPLETWAKLKHPEHGANGIVRGPDGWFYLITGNDAGVSEELAKSPGSPVKHPRCGAVVRFSPDGRRNEVYAHGFRNPYDLDFGWQGNLLTVDADGERDQYLPWYAPNRLFDIAQGQEHGWLLQGFQRSWNRPADFFDNVERLVEIGRGSPTGVVSYRHRQFPQRYRGGLFTACWTLGRVYFFPLAPQDASFQSKLEVFLQTTGDVGFAPVDLAVGPEGDLFVAIGGRGTRGSVFRIRHTESQSRDQDADVLTRVLAADQPLAAWSRARWMPLAKQLGAAPFLAAIGDARRSTPERVRAVEVLTEMFDGLTTVAAEDALKNGDSVVRARVAWSLGRRPNEAGERLLPRMTADEPVVARFAWEAIAAWPDFPPAAGTSLGWSAGMDSPHRRVRNSAIAAARGGAADDFCRWLADQSPLSPRQRMGRHWADGPVAEANRSDERRLRLIDDALAAYAATDETVVKQEAVRLLQIGLGDLHVQPDQAEVYSGYTGNETARLDAAVRQRIVERLSPGFPSGDAALDRELARLFGMLSAEPQGLLSAVARHWTWDSTVESDIHYLIVISRLPGERPADVTAATAHALALLHHKLAAGQMFPSRNWPARLGECFEELLRLDPPLAMELIADPAFTLPEQSLFAARMNSADKPLAARKLLAAVLQAEESADESPWTAELVELVSSLPPEEALPVLRERFDDYSIRDAIALALARQRQPEDRARLLAALDSPQADVILRVAEALKQLPGPAAPAEIAAALRTLKQYLPVKPQRQVREALSRLLRHWSGAEIDIREGERADLAAAYQPWFDWFAKEHADEARRLAASGTVDLTSWQERLAGIDWAGGDTARGQTVYEKRACHRCHRGSSRLGPDLTGAAARLSRDDLFTAIIDPNKDVSPLYQTHLVQTRSGRTYIGLLVYESPGGTLLQTGPDTTVRISGDEFLSMTPSRQSLMPVGLLNNVSNQEAADLYAYLRTLVPKAK